MLAFILICHKDAVQIIRLIKKIKTSRTDIFLHADQEMNRSEYANLATFVEDHEGVYMVQHRIHGMLDHRSLVDITMSCIELANMVETKENKHYKYYALLSGQDYPIKPISWVEKELDTVYPKAFIDCTSYSKSNWVGKKFDRNSWLISYRNWILSHTNPGGGRKVLQLSAVVMRKGLALANKTTAQRMSKLNVSLFGGSAWWILPDIIINYICSEYRKNTSIVEMLLNESLTPEETFFQTMGMMSPFSDCIAINTPDAIGQNCRTFADFGGISNRQIVNHPYVLTIGEFYLLDTTDFWFARKFDRTVDSDILDKIDRELLKFT